METCRVLINAGETEIREHIVRCLSEDDVDKHVQFLAQCRVYASKPRNHLRRTVKLDPVSEFFIYDLVYSIKSKLRKPFKDTKKHFGYRIENGETLNPTESYSGYKGAIAHYSSEYKFSFSFDVASYFNNIYHHDLVSWAANLGLPNEKVESLGLFLRQINSGRSVDCLPQGIYPAKMVGNDFLRFIEQHHGLKSPALIRFMDDIVIFSNNEEHLWEDFYLIQKLLGEKGLSVNPSKSVFATQSDTDFADDVDDVKAELLKKRRKILVVYEDVLEEVREQIELDDEEMDYIRALLKSPNLSEEDAELVLSLFRENPEEVAPHLEEITVRYPHLAKNIWSFSKTLVEEVHGTKDYSVFIASF